MTKILVTALSSSRLSQFYFITYDWEGKLYGKWSKWGIWLVLHQTCLKHVTSSTDAKLLHRMAVFYIERGNGYARGSFPGRGDDFILPATAFRPALWSTASYSLGTGGSFPAGKAAGAWSWLLSSLLVRGSCVELYLHSRSTSSWRDA
jgi:hypothetical protein